MCLVQLLAIVAVSKVAIFVLIGANDYDDGYSFVLVGTC